MTMSDNKKQQELLPLVPDDSYGGLFVATRGFNDNRVLASGTDAAKVIESARAQGVPSPLVFRVPKKGEIMIPSIWKL